MNFIYSGAIRSNLINGFKKSTSFVLALFLSLSSVQGVFAQEATTPIDSGTTTSDPVLPISDSVPVISEVNEEPVLPEIDLAPITPDIGVNSIVPVIEPDVTVMTEQIPVNSQLSEEVTPTPSEAQMLAIGEELPVSNNTPKDSITSKLNVGTNPLTGSLQYQIPIVVPPGRNGLTPDLKLVYNSDPMDEVSPYGYGWSDSIPYIERVNKKGTDKLYSENFFHSTIDGELWPNSTTTNTESYGARYDSGTFFKYEFKNNSFWLVTDKNGIQYKFGSTTSARQTTNDFSRVYRWMLEEVRDRNGNYIKYEYTKDSGQIYPLSIKYTGNGVTDGIFRIDFVTENRPYSATSSKIGFDVVAKKRIAQIRMLVNGALVRKYTPTYTFGDNGRRQLLSTITEVVNDEVGNVITLPSVNLTYQTRTTADAWQVTSSWQSPEDFIDASGNDLGVRTFDVNGDSRVDILVSRSTTGTSTYSRVYLNGGSSWSYASSWNIPVPFTLDYKDLGVRFTDVNGDGLTDILSYKEGGSSVGYINTGGGWTASSTWNPPLPFVATTSGEDLGVRVVDINGDGLPDILRGVLFDSGPLYGTYLNNGVGWATTTNFQVMSPFVKYYNGHYVDLGTRFVELNGDGLIDILSYSQWYTPYNALINQGTQWFPITWNLPSPIQYFSGINGEDFGVRLFDHNGDGITDISKYVVGDDANAASYINDGQSTWSSLGIWKPKYQYVDAAYYDYGARIVDVDGDGLEDVLYARGGNRGVVLNLAKRVDLLTNIRHTEGFNTTIVYKASASYLDGSTPSNQRIPFNIDTVREFSVSDGFGTSSISQYQYGGGRYYFAGPFDRRFAGYATTTATAPVNTVVKSYFHQGDSSTSGLGEYNDEASKIGQVYRTEVYDTNSKLYSLSITKWDKADMLNGRVFVKPIQITELLYDGDSDHKDHVVTYGYIDSTGNIAEQNDYGEVTASSSGAFTDIGSDLRTTNFTYATNTTNYIVGLPSSKLVKNNSGVKLVEERYYYDQLPIGSTTIGNLTKVESWATSTTYVDTERTYNSYGLVTQQLDPRNKPVNYTYDTYNLYPATTTNALSQNTVRLYDYSSGKVRQTIDQNGKIYATIYDALDRVKEEQIPNNLSTSTATVTKAVYEYGDSIGSRYIKKTEYLNSATSTEQYRYLDGLSRPIQERSEMKNPNMYSVRDFKYNQVGDVQVETLPYESTGSSRTSFSSNTALQISYVYDALRRLATTTNELGTETHYYDQWTDTITNRNGKQKIFTFDASSNLIQVDEKNGTSTYVTQYQYDGNGLLIKITDALGNVRNFAYDGLGRRITAEDLHTTGDASYGVWSYTYDASNNVTSTTDPKGQVVNYTYDDLNRTLTEDYIGGVGTEVMYGYDTCTNGKGELCVATTTDAITQFGYDALGNNSVETKKINGVAYTTTKVYNRLGNVTNSILPDNREVLYVYNTAGQLESVSTKQNGEISEQVVTSSDYGPHGQIVSRKFANGTENTNTYDSSKLYRLTNLVTTATTSTVASTTYTVKFYSLSGDGSIATQPWPGIWSVQHPDATGRMVDYTTTSMFTSVNVYNTASGTIAIQRMFTAFDTSSLPDNAIVATATLKLKGNTKNDGWNDQYGYMTVYEGRQSSTTMLANADINDCGSAENNPVKGSDDLDITNAVNGQYNTFTLNATGTAWISKVGQTKLCIRHGRDAENVAPVWTNNSYLNSNLGFNTSETAGTTSDPYLEVTYQLPGTPTTTQIQNIAYEYDPVGNITKITDVSSTTAKKTVVYTYDDLSRLTRASTTQAQNTPYLRTYSYNAIGNITASSDLGSYTYGNTGYINPHAVTAIGTKTFTYDTNGNTLTAASTTYAYDYRNRLATSSVGTTTSIYGYDHTYERVKKTTGGITTIYPNDAWNKRGSTTTIHITDPSGVELATIEGNGLSTTTVYSHQDHLGSTNVLTTQTGTIKEISDYYPYGSPRVQTTYSSSPEQRKFIGEDYDIDSNLSYLNARYYDGSRGQFLSQDPVFWEIAQTKDGIAVLGNPQAQNSYAYAQNNPIVNKDPGGRIFDTVVDIGFIAYDLYKVGDAYFNGGDVQAELGYLALDAAGAATPFATGFGAVARTAKVANTASDLNRIPDSALCVRGGSCSPESFVKGNDGPLKNGKVTNVSVNSASNVSVKGLSEGIPHSKVGVTTVGSVRKAGGNVVSSPTRNNPNHATLSGLTPSQASSLFKSLNNLSKALSDYSKSLKKKK